MKYLALLRGVNVGGKNLLPMKSLVEIFVAAGGKDVLTYIQSGNVIFSGNPKVAASVCGTIEAQFAFKTTIILRSLAELEVIAAGNPYPDTEKSHILCLASQPTPEQLAQLDPLRCPPDQFAVSGKNVYLYLPNGTAGTKLTNAYFDSKLKTVSTLRNWRTLLRLLAMMTG